MWGPNHSFFREKLALVNSLPVVCCCAGGEVYGKVVSQPLLPILICSVPHSLDVEISLG